MNAQINEDVNVSFDESISVARTKDNVYDIVLNTMTTIGEISTNATHRNSLMPLRQADALLLDILDNFDLSSLSISISETSLAKEKSFPVGTAIQFKSSNGNEDNAIEYELLRVLSYRNLLCENVEKEPFYSGKIRAVLKSDDSKVIMLPNDAYSLCHSRELIHQIISSSPCRNSAGVFQGLQPSLNGFDIVNKAAWVEVTKSENGVQIDKGLRFGRIVPDGKINAAQLLGGEIDLLSSCPLAKKSTLILKDSTGTKMRDLKVSALDMQEELVLESMQTDAKSFGIERSNERVNGMSNEGRLITRVYVGDDIPCSSNDKVHVRLEDIYPSIINPTYHSLKISLASGPSAGNDVSTLKQSLECSKHAVSELALHDVIDDLKLSSDGSGVLSLSTTMPRDSSLYIQLDYKPKYLNFESFPADPNRGFDLFPSFATFSCHTNATNENITTTMYSNALLIMPPVPDLSMPFNVISIASTFFALIIGTTINLTVRKSRESVVDKLNGTVRPSVKDKLREKLQRLKNKVLKRRQPTPMENTAKDKVE